ncbi:tyrosine-type recombinase/integrase [Vibrio quintilis]|uniref:Phage integrase family protein n=1 Tax=Vibrio quintilis TaxID=1117707 RepID=A0A1M7Z0D8_9VIBR|nr:tyrosine-type recombinase/integrase [Vibrio quintilis]SHO58282.1 Phage integrase family protein [Vibrio quintilis]
MNTFLNPWYSTIWLYDSDFEQRKFPLVYLANGMPSYTINQYIYHLLESEISHNKLESSVRALCHLYAFTCAYYGQRILTSEEASYLVANFIDAKKFGTDEFCIRNSPRFSWLKNLGLNWKPLSLSKNGISTIKGYIRAITNFDKWQANIYNIQPLNPTEKYFISAWRQYKKFETRKEWDPLIHLELARKRRKQTEEKYSSQVENKLNSNHKRLTIKNKLRIRKAFPLGRFIDLVETASNPRDKMLILLQGGGSLRRSEPLHIFHSDIEGQNEFGEARIRIDDPEIGMVEWRDHNGKLVSGTRIQYFQQYWAMNNQNFPDSHPLKFLGPRTLMDRKDSGLNAGFKGMTFAESSCSDWLLNERSDGRTYDVNHLWWLDPVLGSYWYELFEEYEENYLRYNYYTGERNPTGFPFHPWLFIAIDREHYGAPLSIPAMKKIWARLKKRLGIEETLGWHSLRHMFGYYCANVLKIPPEITQFFLHHSSVSSTNAYYHINHNRVRYELTTKQLMAAGIEYMPEHLILKDTPIPNWPSAWQQNPQYKLYKKILMSHS